VKLQKQNLKERKIKMGRVKSYYFDNLEIRIDEDTMQEDEKLVFEEQFDPNEPEDIPNGWDVDTELNLDRDVPGNQND